MEAAFCFAVKIFVGKLSPIVKRTVACIDAAASTVAADSCMYGITAFFSVVTKQAHFILQLTVVVAVDQVQFTAAGISQGRTTVDAEGFGFANCVQQIEVVAQGIIHLAVGNAQTAAVAADGHFITKIVVAHIFVA